MVLVFVLIYEVVVENLRINNQVNFCEVLKF